MEYNEQQLLTEKEKIEPWVSQHQGVTGTGIGLDRGGRMCIKIFTNHMPAETKTEIERRLGQLPVDFEETGEFRAF